MCHDTKTRHCMFGISMYKITFIEKKCKITSLLHLAIVKIRLSVASFQYYILCSRSYILLKLRNEGSNIYIYVCVYIYICVCVCRYIYVCVCVYGIQ